MIEVMTPPDLFAAVPLVVPPSETMPASPIMSEAVAHFAFPQVTEADDVAVTIMGAITHMRLTTGTVILVDGGKHL